MNPRNILLGSLATVVLVGITIVFFNDKTPNAYVKPNTASFPTNQQLQKNSMNAQIGEFLYDNCTYIFVRQDGQDHITHKGNCTNHFHGNETDDQRRERYRNLIRDILDRKYPPKDPKIAEIKTSPEFKAQCILECDELHPGQGEEYTNCRNDCLFPKDFELITLSPES